MAGEFPKIAFTTRELTNQGSTFPFCPLGFQGEEGVSSVHLPPKPKLNSNKTSTCSLFEWTRCQVGIHSLTGPAISRLQGICFISPLFPWRLVSRFEFLTLKHTTSRSFHIRGRYV